MAAQSKFAHEFLQKTVDNYPSVLELRDTLNALHSLVDALQNQPAANEMKYANARPTPRPPLEQCDMPPAQSAINVIREAKSE